MRQVWRKWVGIGLILLGLVGLFTPILQGIFLILGGITLANPEFAKKHFLKIYLKMEKKFGKYFSKK